MPTTTSTTSWLAKRLLTALPALLLLFTSCEEPTDIGLENQPDSELGVSYLEYTAIESSSVLLDSALETTGGNVQLNHLVGHIEDDVFGKVTAATYAELRLNNTGVTFANNAVVTSVELKLDYKGAYGVGDKPLTFRIHELTQSINPDSSYYTTDRRTYNAATVLGADTITPVNLKPTSARPVYLSIPLSNSFGERILDLGRNGQILDDHTEFRQAIKGLAIVPETGEGGRSVAIFGFEKDADSSFVRIRYTQNGENRSLKLFLDRATRRFHSIETNRAGTVLAPLVTNGNSIAPVNMTGYPETFIQAGGGVRTILRFPGLENLREQLGSEIAINKAELVIPVVGGSATQYAPPAFLTLTDARGTRIDTTSTGNPSYIGDDRAPSLQQLLRYDASKGQYTAQLGSYLQSLLYGKRINKGMVVSSTSNSVQVNRARLPVAGPAGIRLRIYYTKVL